MGNCLKLNKCHNCKKSIIKIFLLYTQSYSICTVCLIKAHDSCLFSSQCPNCRCNNSMIISNDYINIQKSKQIDLRWDNNNENYSLI